MSASPFLASLLLGLGLVSGVSRAEDADPAAPLDLEVAAAESALASGDLAQAEARYRDALFDGWLLSAALDRLDKRTPEAREALHQASLFAPSSREGLHALANAHLQAGEPGKAADILQALAAKDPRDGESRRLLARALAAQGQAEAAAARLAEAAAASDDPELLFLVATDYLWLKRPSEAAALYARVLRARPLPQTHVLVGRAWRDAGDYDRARAELSAALAADPAVRRAHYYTGMVILADARSGPDRLQGAIAEFALELKLAPEDPAANDQLGLALLEDGRAAEALPALEAAVKGQPRAAFVSHLGRCQLALDRPAEAATTLRRALELAQEHGSGEEEIGSIHYQLGLALRKLGETAESAAQLAAASRAPRASEGDGAASASDASDPLAELPLFKRQALARRVASTLARSCFNLGVLSAQERAGGTAAERFARAAAFFESAAAIDPGFPQVQSSLGVAYFNARQFDKAAAPLERAVAASPDDAALKRTLATAWLNTGAWDKAAALLEHDPARAADPALQLGYGLALLRGGHPAEAAAALAALPGAEGESAEVAALRAEALAAQRAQEARPRKPGHER